MITIFNRKELTVVFDTKRQAQIRDILSGNGIDYYIKTVNRLSPSPFSAGSRSRVGSIGINYESIYEYVFYVKKRDYEKAAFLIKG